MRPSLLLAHALDLGTRVEVRLFSLASHAVWRRKNCATLSMDSYAYDYGGYAAADASATATTVGVGAAAAACCFQIVFVALAGWDRGGGHPTAYSD